MHFDSVSVLGLFTVGRYQVRIRALLYAIPSNLKCVTFDFPAFYTISF